MARFAAVTAGASIAAFFRRYPIVTALQLGFDATIATTIADGLRHVCVPQHYIDAGAAVADPRG
jgi:uncharacterized membrane protein